MFWLISFFTLGSVLGSFANVCIWRLPRKESIAWPPSHCPHCQGKLRPQHLLPLISWLALRGKCAMCKGTISIRYPAVELATALLFAAIGYRWQLSITSLQYCTLSLALIISVATDISHREVPDEVSLGSAAILAVVAIVTAQWGHLLGGILLFSILFLIAVASRGGMGGGDIKLALAIGLGLGWKLALVSLALAIVVGGVLATALLLRGNRGKALPFAPFLAAGTWITMFCGEKLVEFYLSIVLRL